MPETNSKDSDLIVLRCSPGIQILKAAPIFQCAAEVENHCPLPQTSNPFRRHFSLNILHEILMSQIYCISVYVLYAQLCFIHKQRIFHSPRIHFHALGGDVTPTENACFRLCRKIWFCPSVYMSSSKANFPKWRRESSDTKSQAGQRQEGDQIHSPHHPCILSHGCLHGLKFLCAFYHRIILQPQRTVNVLPNSNK